MRIRRRFSTENRRLILFCSARILRVNRLCQALELSVPFSAVVEVPQELIDLESKLVVVGRGDKFLGGLQFASLFQTEAVQDHFDRSRYPGNLLRVGSPGNYYLCVIDNGQILPGGSNWSIQSLTAQARTITPYSLDGGSYKFLIPFVTGPAPFEAALSRLENLSEQEIGLAVGEVPPEWGVSSAEADALTEFLLLRRTLVREKIEELRRDGQFPNWKQER